MSTTEKETIIDLTEQVAALSVSQNNPQQAQQKPQQQQQAKKGQNTNNNKKAPPGKKGGKKNDSDFDFDIDEFVKDADAKSGKQQPQGGNKNKVQSGKNAPTTANSPKIDPFAAMTDCTEHISRTVGKKPTDKKDLTFKNEAGEEVKQTTPPSIPPTKFYAEAMPEGEFLQFLQESNTYRTTSEELKEKEKITPEAVKALREGAEIHRHARQDLQKYTRPGVRIIDLANRVERSVLTMVEANGYERTRGFPTGINLNHIAAHDSPNGGDTRVIKETDTIKIDFGVSINGTIIDSAFTVHFDEQYDPLVEAVKAATMEGIKHAGPDMRVGDLGGLIQEVMESYEVTINGKTLPVKCIQNLCGHEIGPAPRKIHGGVSIPLYNNHDQTKMQEGRCYAIETFGTNDPLAKIREEGECSHYMRCYDIQKPLARSQGAIKLWNVINKNFNTLAFCKRWLDEVGQKDYVLYLKQLCDAGSVDPYPPLCVRKGYQTAQFEHTIFLHPTKTEVISKDWDY